DRAKQIRKEEAEERRRSRQRSELEELRAYKESHEKKIAAEKSLEDRKAEEMEREREFEALEARILQAIPKASQSYTTSNSNGTSDEISTKSRKLIEALLDDELSLEGVTSWDEVQKRVGALKPAVLKSILQVRTSETLPRSNAGEGGCGHGLSQSSVSGMKYCPPSC
ncbi:unnamed protein product, partial [Symbiodinium sp. KB8]